ILVDPRAQYSGSVTLALAALPPDDEGGIAIGGSSIVTITTAGQNGKRSFSGSVGQRVTLNVTGSTIGYADLRILKPDGTGLDHGGLAAQRGSDLFVDTLTLPVSGS